MYPETDYGYGVPDRRSFRVSVIQYGNLWQYLSSMHLEIGAGIVLVEKTDSQLAAVALLPDVCAG